MKDFDEDLFADEARPDAYDPACTAEENERRYTQHVTKMKQLYTAGKPLFTKEDIRQVKLQLEKAARTPKSERFVRYKLKNYDEQEVERIYAIPEIWEHYASAPLDEVLDEMPDDKEILDKTEDSSDFYEPEKLEAFEEMEKRLVADTVSVASNDRSLDGPAVIHYGTVQTLLSKGEFLMMESPSCTLSIYNVAYQRDAQTGNPKIRERRPYGDIVNKFASDLHCWETSAACSELKDILTSFKLPSKINKIIAYSCGSMSYSFDSIEPTECSNYQHALVSTIRKILESKNEASSIRCFAQDPIYTEDDKKHLQSKGIDVLQDPDGFLEVDDNSVVISCASNVSVKQIVSDLAHPAMMIWDQDDGKPEAELLRSRMTDPYSPRLRELIRRHYDTHTFPGDEKMFGKLNIFVRRGQKGTLKSTQGCIDGRL